MNLRCNNTPSTKFYHITREIKQAVATSKKAHGSWPRLGAHIPRLDSSRLQPPRPPGDARTIGGPYVPCSPAITGQRNPTPQQKQRNQAPRSMRGSTVDNYIILIGNNPTKPPSTHARIRIPNLKRSPRFGLARTLGGGGGEPGPHVTPPHLYTRGCVCGLSYPFTVEFARQTPRGDSLSAQRTASGAGVGVVAKGNS